MAREISFHTEFYFLLFFCHTEIMILLFHTEIAEIAEIFFALISCRMAGRSPFLPFPLFLRDKNNPILRDKKICEICEICVRLKLYICVK